MTTPEGNMCKVCKLNVIKGTLGHPLLLQPVVMIVHNPGDTKGTDATKTKDLPNKCQLNPLTCLAQQILHNRLDK